MVTQPATGSGRKDSIKSASAMRNANAPPRQLSTNTIYDQDLVRLRKEVSASFLHYLFAETVRYCLLGVYSSHQLEDRLHELGVRVGWRLLEPLSFRERPGRRETRLIGILTFIATTCWKHLFGHHGDLLRGQGHNSEYMINDKNLPLTRYVSVPEDAHHLSVAAYVAGIVEGILCSAEFPGEVTAHTIEESRTTFSTTILIRFLPEVIAREKRLAAASSQ